MKMIWLLGWALSSHGYNKSCYEQGNSWNRTLKVEIEEIFSIWIIALQRTTPLIIFLIYLLSPQHTRFQSFSLFFDDDESYDMNKILGGSW